MDEEKIIELYVTNKYTLRHIAEEFNTNHHKIKRILLKNNIPITKRNTLKEFSQSHKDKISESRKKLFNDGKIIPWMKGKKMSRNHTLKNMINHLKYDVEYEWVNQFEDIEKLKYLNRCVSRKRDSELFTTEIYMRYIEKFYYDEKFNYLYNEWLKSGDKWIKPSLDHIKPKSFGGGIDDIDNLCFISWFENRSKCDIDLYVWEKMKRNILYYL